jgi:hypothetical protein
MKIIAMIMPGENFIAELLGMLLLLRRNAYRTGRKQCKKSTESVCFYWNCPILPEAVWKNQTIFLK